MTPSPQQPASIDTVLQDPEFHQQPMGWKLSTLRANYPEFSALHPNDQGRLLAKAQQDAVGQTAAMGKLQKSSEDPGFWSTIGHDVAAIPGAIVKFAGDAGQLIQNPSAAADPNNTFNKIVRGQVDQAKAAKQSFKQGDMARAAGHAVAAALPMAGPAAAETGEELGDLKFGQGSAHALELLGPSTYSAAGELGVLPKKLTFGRTVKNVNNATEDAALAQASTGMLNGKQVAPPVRMTPWQRAGARGTEKAARNLTNMPGSAATKAEDFYAGQQQDIAAQGGRIADIDPTGKYGPSPLPLDDLGAGKSITKALEDRIQASKATADNLYDSIRQDTASNTQNVPTGKQSPPSTVLGANGQPAVGSQPIMAQMASPVELDPIRAQLESVYEDLSNGFTPEKKLSSPAYTALKNFMESPKTHMPAMDFDKFLGALKSITRDGQAGELSNQSAGLAKQVIQAGENGLNDALTQAGPNTVSKLQKARAAVKDYHDTNDFLTDSRVRPNEPYEAAAMYRSFVRPLDGSVEALQKLQSLSPETIPVIAQTKLQSLFDRAAQNGGWSKSQGVRGEWNKLGPNTKKMLYGPEKAEALDNFFHSAEMLTPAEGSPTAGRLAAITSYGDVGLALGEFLRGAASGTLEGAGQGAAAAAGIIGATRGLPAILAKISFKPAGAQLLRQAVTVPINSAAFNRAMLGLNALAGNPNTAQRMGQSIAQANQGQ